MRLIETVLYQRLVNAQTFAPPATTPTAPMVEKKISDPIGSPIGDEQPQQVSDPNSLPVLDVSDIGKYLEDSFDEEQQLDQETQDVEQEEMEAPQPEEPEKQYPTFSNPFEASNWAEQNNEVMRISYTTKHGRQLGRDVEPHGQFHSDSTKHQILVTFDESVGDIRAYIISNIRSWAFTGKQFQKRFSVKA